MSVPSGTWTTRILGDCNICHRCAVWLRHFWADVRSRGCCLTGPSLEPRLPWTQTAGWRYPPPNPLGTKYAARLESGPLANRADMALQAKSGCKAFLRAAGSAGPSQSAKHKAPLCCRLPSLGGEGPCLLVPVLPLCPG